MACCHICGELDRYTVCPDSGEFCTAAHLIRSSKVKIRAQRRVGSKAPRAVRACCLARRMGRCEQIRGAAEVFHGEVEEPSLFCDATIQLPADFSVIAGTAREGVVENPLRFRVLLSMRSRVTLSSHMLWSSWLSGLDVSEAT